MSNVLVKSRATVPNIWDVVEANIQEEREENKRERISHYASGIISCPRRFWYEMHGISESNPTTFTGWFKMSVGSAIGRMIADALNDAWDRQGLPPVMEMIEQTCPRMAEDIQQALDWEIRPLKPEYIRSHTVIELPFRHDVGLELPVSCRLDIVSATPVGLPCNWEIKSSSSYSTKVVQNTRRTHLNYLLQGYIQAQRYPELPTMIQYLDREWGYPFAFGIEDIVAADGTVMAVFQPGGWHRMGTDYAPLLNGIHPWEFIIERCRWMEEVMHSDEPPGELVVHKVKQARGGIFYMMELKGLKHPTYIPDEEDYRLVVNTSGGIEYKKQANNVVYKSGLCRAFCRWRDHCAGCAGLEIAPPPREEFRDWGNALVNPTTGLPFADPLEDQVDV